MQGSLFRGLAPYGRLRLHLNLALWHLRQSVRHASSVDDGTLVHFIEVMCRGAADSVADCLNEMGGVHPINTEDYSR